MRHLDIKPENLLMNRTKVVIADFGLAIRVKDIPRHDSRYENEQYEHEHVRF